MNDPLPSQLTVGRLRELLKEADDHAVVTLLVRDSINVPSPFRFALVNWKVATISPQIVIFELEAAHDKS